MTSQTDQFQDEIDLKDIILPIWRAKWWIATIGLVLAMLTAVYQLGGFVLNKQESLAVQVHFDFQGADNGQYPNGTKFSPQELLSGAVLSELYQNLNTDAYSYEDLTDALMLTPNFVGSERLENMVVGLVAKDKGLSTKDFSEAVAGYTNSLKSYSKIYVTLSIDLSLVNGNAAKASYILTQIPSIWAKQALADRGVLATSLPTITNPNSKHISKELLVKVNVLADTHQLLTDYTDGLATNINNRTIKDPASGQTLSDLIHSLSLEEKYRIAILKELIVKYGIGVNNADWYRGFREARLGKLEREQASLERMVQVYEEAMVQFNQQQDQANNTSASNNSNGSSVYAPQYGEDVINTLLQLGSQMADPEYRKKLLEEKIKLSTRLQKIVTEIQFYSAEEQDNNQPDIGMEEVNALIDESFATLNTVNTALENITRIANESRLDNQGELYNLVGSVEKQGSSNLSNSALLKIILAFIAGCMLATMLVLFRRLMK